ncbi:MAG: hypothetical protein DIU80_011715 [Chloroflexota bacterium]
MNETQTYLLSLPERAARALAAIAGGLIHESTSVLLPASVRRTRLYQATVARLLRLVIEIVGDVHGIFPDETISARDLLARKTAGNVIELAGFLAVGWSPIWLLAAASDIIGGARIYLHALVDELKRSGALPEDADIQSFEQLLRALEGTSGTMADAIDVPPLNVRDLRAAWEALRSHSDQLPGPERLAALFGQLQRAAGLEGRSLLEVSAAVALGAARAGITMGNVYLFDYYREALGTIAAERLATYLRRVSRPYLTRAVGHFDRAAPSYTERLVRRFRPNT